MGLNQPVMDNRSDENLSPNYDQKGSRVALAGTLAGLLAGLCMGVLAMLVSAGTGMGLFFPLKLIAASLYGVDSLIGGASVVTLGFVIHFIVSALFGIMFASLTRSAVPVRGPFLRGGIVFGVVIWAVMTFLLLPVVNPIMYNRVLLQPVWWFVEHLVFGAVLATTPYFRNALARPSQDENVRPLRRVA